MGKAPSFQFYPSDWMRDLTEHPLEIEGAWIRICCALFWSETKGTSDKTLTKWARILRVGERKCQTIIAYLDNHNIADVINQNGSIQITSRRMMKDEHIRKIRKFAGLQGGNPSLKSLSEKGHLVKQALLNQKCPSSSSSSSSSSGQKNNKPQAAFSLPDWIPSDAWNGYEEMRKTKRAPLTDRARFLTVRKLEDFRGRGDDPEAVLNQSIQNAWTGVYPIRAERGGGVNGAERESFEQRRDRERRERHEKVARGEL